MARFYSDALDLSQLPAPNVIEPLSYEEILGAITTDLIARFAAAGLDLDTMRLQFEPAAIIAQSFAYGELLFRARVNAAAKAMMLAYATGGDLDHLGANKGVVRLVVDEGDTAASPPVPPTYETDADFRKRIQLSPEGYTTAGSEGSYVFHGLAADGDIKDIQAISPAPGEIAIYILSRSASGAANTGLIATVSAALNSDEIRPLTDQVTVQSAVVTNYAIAAELVIYPGPDSEVVRQAAFTAVSAYAASVHRIGYDVSLSGLYAALHQPGVKQVNLTAPVTNLVAGDGEAFFASSIAITASEAGDV